LGIFISGFILGPIKPGQEKGGQAPDFVRGISPRTLKNYFVKFLFNKKEVIIYLKHESALVLSSV
jgi:hypothetical protein